ncbi:hypothetical protein M2451_004083 [Dysgonomonas sp. PFB1-18]|uniref:hypothetical protein n=1 Tax=unclassified Dysgonomonas TaxID=2630389 RepID=UPI00247328E7|nr:MULTISPECIES: hypothetical protein [unclassified Dysgonomonas]MDH6310490.1 hypothetical protein [Dysgonomonas sp. PF1-14]MDH6340928.1 hypothetical protein [Dysgonomonas sp. PF1-16]MDH6382734.1 hypothetical protein [Dysgonomonas sp. PFB1-18]MDH6399877.1 hypothetical protein [Dysgonomonas sp. PF1-23]
MLFIFWFIDDYQMCSHILTSRRRKRPLGDDGEGLSNGFLLFCDHRERKGESRALCKSKVFGSKSKGCVATFGLPERLPCFFDDEKK